MSERGFTLLEVLVALAVVALALSAVISTTGSALGHTALLRERAVARWIVLNKAAEWQATGHWPGAGASEGESEMAGGRWWWRAEVVETEDREVRRVEFSAGAEGSDEPADRLTAYLGAPLGADGEGAR